MGSRKKEIALEEERTGGELQRCYVFVKESSPTTLPWLNLSRLHPAQAAPSQAAQDSPVQRGSASPIPASFTCAVFIVVLHWVLAEPELLRMVAQSWERSSL
jgi:hypothetical protein